MNIFDGDETNSYDHSPAEPEAAVPATEIAKAVKGARKKAPKAPAKKAAKPAKKTAKAEPAKKAAAKKNAAPAKKAQKAGHTRAGTPYVKYDSGKRRGPGGGGKLVRRGDAEYGAKVAKARHAKALAQTQAAKKLGIGQPSLSNIEKGTVGASYELQVKINKLLGVKIAAKAPKAK